jgi:hypothetical protein
MTSTYGTRGRRALDLVVLVLVLALALTLAMALTLRQHERAWSHHSGHTPPLVLAQLLLYPDRASALRPVPLILSLFPGALAFGSWRCWGTGRLGRCTQSGSGAEVGLSRSSRGLQKPFRARQGGTQCCTAHTSRSPTAYFGSNAQP